MAGRMPEYGCRHPSPILAPPGDQRERIRQTAVLAIDAIARGSLGYALIAA
jgi:hypothetical protein